MSVQPTNATKYQEFHGIKLANGAVIANFVVEKLAAVPATLEAGRSWYNTTDNTFQFVKHNGTELVVATVATAAELADAVSKINSDLSSTTAGKGSGLVGFSGQTGTNGKFSVSAGTTEVSLQAIVSGLDSEIKNREDAVQASKDELAASTGATKVGYEGQAGANGKITVGAGTVTESLDSLVDQIDAQFGELGDDALSKTKLADQTVASKVTFGGDVVIEGNIIVSGESFLIEGNVVELGDNIILLNRDNLFDVPIADAGLEVNRGAKGTLPFLTWDESAKEVVVPVVTVDGETGDETIVQSRVIDGVEFDAYGIEVDGRLDTLEDQVNGKIGNLNTLATDDKSTIVAAINELHTDAQDDRDNLASVAGAGLVGYEGQAGVNGLLSVISGTVEASIDAVVLFVDAEAKAADDYITSLSSTTAGQGSSLVGFAGQGVVGTDEFALPAGSVNASIGSIVTAIKEDREAINALEQADANLKAAINGQSFKATSASALVHTIAHNLNSLDVTVGLWIKDGSSWVNHQAHTKLVDANTVEVTCSTAAEIKVLVKKFEDLV